MSTLAKKIPAGQHGEPRPKQAFRGETNPGEALCAPGAKMMQRINLAPLWLRVGGCPSKLGKHVSRQGWPPQVR